MAIVEISDSLADELRAICGHDYVFTGRSARFNRARVPAPFPVHRWDEFAPSAVVLPRTAAQVSEVVKLANRHRIPIVPRAGGTGLTDGAVPLRHGILVDVKLMNEIKEIDLVDRTVTVGPGINMLKLNEELRKHGVIYPDNPASYPCSLVGGRIGTSGWSLIGGRYGHTRDLVVSFELVLPTGEIIRVGDGGGKKVRKSSSGYQLKHLFMGHQGTLGIVTEATLELVPRPEAEFSAFFAYPDYLTAWRSTGALATSGIATLAGVVLFDERKLDYLRRDDEAYIPQPADVRSVVATAMYGNADEVRAGAKRLLRIGLETGGRYLGDEISQGDWASRHDRYATPLHGRLRNGQVVPMSWHCEDASIPYSALPKVREEWHAIADRLRERFDMFDDWGMFAYTNGAYKPWADYLTEIDIGIWEMRWDDESWAAWVEAKRDIAAVALRYGGSISACHGSCREGEVDLVPEEMGGGWEVMKKIKRALDPNNIMNPGKYLLDEAYEDEEVTP
ncbi:MAG: FAD-binding oxidoreductase [Thermoleophilia bacterium]|nr:FAD-binding oxidoreductase [Gaiellaceae bacterium]MDW8337594.1 FAD-binding oxidoreductase [Thermoleophilia bacterium]